MEKMSQNSIAEMIEEKRIISPLKKMIYDINKNKK